jgi:hydrogenase expression/formation protein HypC
MCLAVPGQIVSISDSANRIATIELAGVRRDVSVALLDDVRVGDWVIVHTGIAIEKLDEGEARKTIELLADLERTGRNDRGAAEARR